MDSLAALIKMTGEPLVSTSVNLAGQPPLNRIAEIRREFPGIDVYISRRGAGSRNPSTLIDLTGRDASIIRPGSIVRRMALAFGID